MSPRIMRSILSIAVLLACTARLPADPPPGDGWEPLFNGENLDGWAFKEDLPEEAKDDWTVVDGVIDCRPRLEPRGDKSLYTTRTFRDYVLQVEWRIKETQGRFNAQLVQPDGTVPRDAEGKPKTITIKNADSGIYNRGYPKAQINIWCWPIGSGEVYGYRNDATQPPDVRAGVTPKVNADNPVGEWNTFVITMRGERLSVQLNGQVVLENARLPGIPEEGPIALQHHGGYDAKTGQWNGASSLVQFRNIYIKELP
jgi:hypothetical protein